ncbi:hypothetical protein HPB49_005657 [Dermacentor silvarum]|uniref:Uncharacterized protein n=1 Tax=Dermacentor silvarum TaxID=543639 RepID=A0ACB8CQ60_DERSI|nr:hypothetical protein HPB49_005657 [Dermacentor silvarum]
MVCVRRLKHDPIFGVDSRWSWITAFFCAWVLFLGMATPRIAGIFFYGIIETFGVTRAEASWPVSLAGTFTVIGGPIAGYLCQRFSCRAVLLACSSLAGIGASSCYLAKSLLFITISFGFVHGAALCGFFVACNVLVAQHFEKRRATATSLVFTVFGFNSVILSPLLEFFRTTYGVRDLASDRGLNPSNVVYFLQAFSAADIVFRSLVGFAIDSGTLSYEFLMLLGFTLQGLTYEWLVWANTLPQMIAASAFVGATFGSRSCLLAPALVKDFGIGTLPVIMGGVLFCTGVSLLLRPPLIGHYRDTYGDYTGLLHLMAVLNAFFVCIWALKLAAERRSRTTASTSTYGLATKFYKQERQRITSDSVKEH